MLVLDSIRFFDFHITMTLRRLAWIVLGVACAMQGVCSDKTPRINPGLGAPATNREYETALARLLEKSSNPRDRVLSTEMYDPAFEVPNRKNFAKVGSIRRETAQAAPDDFWLQWLWANAFTDASGCDVRNPCPERTGAAARAQPNNAAAWLPVLNAAVASNDAKVVEAALARMAAADRYYEPAEQIAKAWLGVLSRYPPPPTIDMRDIQFGDAMLFAFNIDISATSMMTIPDYHGLFKTCDREKQPKGNQQHFEACASVARLMLRANTMTARWEGRTLLILSGRATHDDVALVRSFLWQTDQLQRLAEKKPADRSINGGKVEVRKEMADAATGDSEIDLLHRQLQSAHIPLEPPANWQPALDGKPMNPLAPGVVFTRNGY